MLIIWKFRKSITGRTQRICALHAAPGRMFETPD